MPAPLEGIRAVNWTIWQQGPACSVMLAGLGAEVVQIDRLGPPVGLGETPARSRHTAPELGEHPDEVLADVLAYSAARIADLRQRNIV